MPDCCYDEETLTFDGYYVATSITMVLHSEWNCYDRVSVRFGTEGMVAWDLERARDLQYCWSIRQLYGLGRFTDVVKHRVR